MLQATLVTTEEELKAIHRLNQQNLKAHLSPGEMKEEGFVTWLYPLALLQNMHRLAPGVIVKDGDKVVGYALATPKEASVFHPDLQNMIRHLEDVMYTGKPLSAYRYYCMGQICMDKSYRGKGLVKLLYEQHKKTYSPQYDLLITEISTSNPRSLRAHEKIGFKTAHIYRDAMDEWNVVIWDWQ